MRRSYALFIVFILNSLFPYYLIAQSSLDSAKHLSPVQIKTWTWFGDQPLMASSRSVGIIGSSQLKEFNAWSPVGLANTIAGLRMEERSPGSYRLSIRGSLLRSPYGVRDVKVYISDMPLTDAGGNSYLGSVDLSALKRIEILKGPSGALYGANKGGVILLSPISSEEDEERIALNISTGTFGSYNQSLRLNHQSRKFRISFFQSYLHSDGYRMNSAVNRQYYHLAGDFHYANKHNLQFFAFYSNLNYRTPGGLTAEQMYIDPRQSRPGTAVLPGAKEQKAGIYNKTIYVGFSNRLNLSNGFSFLVAPNVSYTDFKNPFITNYEERYETTVGIRSYLEWRASLRTSQSIKFQLGGETQQTISSINNSKNNQGVRDTLQVSDKLWANQRFLFLRGSIEPVPGFYLEASASRNIFNYEFEKRYPFVAEQKRKRFKNQMLPHFSASFTQATFSIRASSAKGYSSPTLSEIRPSNNIINQDLEAEYGWNHELGIRLSPRHGRFNVDLAYFYLNMKNAIVRQLDYEGNEFFENRASTRQRGVELETDCWILPYRNTPIVRSLRLFNTYTLSRFYFKNASVAGADVSGNRLTGIPQGVLVSRLQLSLKYNVAFHVEHNYTSSQPLNDLNSAWANPFHLFNTRLSWERIFNKRFRISSFLRVENLGNRLYSLGNDINAFGGRYYNPAPGRNYGFGVKVSYL